MVNQSGGRYYAVVPPVPSLGKSAMQPANIQMTSSYIVLTALVWLASVEDLTAGDDAAWFRRDHGIVSADVSLPSEFGDGEERLWRAELPPGISTPCICGDSIFITTFVAETKELATVALDQAMGKIRWKQVVPTQTLEAFHRVGSPAASSPACNGSQVFSFFGSYGMLCYDLNGTLL